jgi:soluble lytic murein transglycosylase-like protein
MALQTVLATVCLLSVMLLSAGAPAFAQDAVPTQTDVARPSGALGNETREVLCLIIASAAKANDLPLEFFARVIWQESRFQSDAVGPVTRNGQRAQGIAQLIKSRPAGAIQRASSPMG